MTPDAKFSDLKGKTLLSITGVEERDEEIIFKCTDGTSYKMFHYQDCCESVSLIDVMGDVCDVLGSEILLAEETLSYEGQTDLDWTPESQTWTFYKLATVQGYLDLRWYGHSNGYYSERVDFEQIDP